MPETWDLVRRAVDAGAAPGSFPDRLLAPARRGSYCGAGRILSLRMRPLALSERGLATPTVSIEEFLRERDQGFRRVRLWVGGLREEIVASGFPGLRLLAGRALRAQLDGYLSRSSIGTSRSWVTAFATRRGCAGGWPPTRQPLRRRPRSRRFAMPPRRATETSRPSRRRSPIATYWNDCGFSTQSRLGRPRAIGSPVSPRRQSTISRIRPRCEAARRRCRCPAGRA